MRCLLQRGCDSRDRVVVGSTLTCGEHGIIHTLLEVLASLAILAEKDEASSGTTKRFVSRKVLLRSLVISEIADTYVVVVTTSQYWKGSASS